MTPELERKKVALEGETQAQIVEKKVAVSSLQESVEISPRGKKIIEFFRLHRNNPEKLKIFQDNIMSAENIEMKKALDEVLSIITKEALEDKQSVLAQAVAESARKKTKLSEICSICGGTKATCSGYLFEGDSWPYFENTEVEEND